MLFEIVVSSLDDAPSSLDLVLVLVYELEVVLELEEGMSFRQLAAAGPEKSF